MNLDKIKGVVFDLDGVLVNTEYYQSEAWIKTLKAYRVFLSQEDLFEYKGKVLKLLKISLKINIIYPLKKVN